MLIAASSGGVAAIGVVLSALPEHFTTAVAVVLHRPAGDPDPLAGVLARRCVLPVRAAAEGARLVGGQVSVLPVDRQARLGPGGTLRCQQLLPKARASADLVLQDAADGYGKRALAVVLTGRRSDGALGVRAVKRAGGLVLVQDPTECAAPEMPTAALATGCVDHRLPLRVIGPAIVALTMVPGAADLYRVPPSPWASLDPAG